MRDTIVCYTDKGLSFHDTLEAARTHLGDQRGWFCIYNQAGLPLATDEPPVDLEFRRCAWWQYINGELTYQD